MGTFLYCGTFELVWCMVLYYIHDLKKKKGQKMRKKKNSKNVVFMTNTAMNSKIASLSASFYG